MTRRTLIPTLTGVVLAIAGCGGGDTKTTTERSDAPAAKESLSAAAKRLERALPQGDCKVLIRLMLHSIERGTTNPATPPSRSDCDYIAGERRNVLQGYRFARAQEFGPAGFTQGTGPRAGRGQVVGIVWLRDFDGAWKAAFDGDAVYRPQLRVAPTLPAAFDANARALVEVVRRRDCDAFWRLAHVASRFGINASNRRESFCKTFPGFYKNADSAFVQIQKDRRAAPRLLGRTRDFGFYGLRLANGREMVIVLARPIGGIADEEQKRHAIPAVLEFLTVRLPRAEKAAS